MAINKLILVTILVRDQEKSLQFYTNNLGFVKTQDITDQTGFRWVTVAPKNQKEIAIVLRKPHANDNEIISTEIERSIVRGTLWSFSTSDCQKTYEELMAKGVNFLAPPTRQRQGIEAVFEDIDGNRFNLLEVK